MWKVFILFPIRFIQVKRQICKSWLFFLTNSEKNQISQHKVFKCFAAMGLFEYC